LYVYEAAGANHGANLNQLDPAEAAEAIATLRRWAGLPAAALRGGVALTDEVETEAANQNFRPRL